MSRYPRSVPGVVQKNYDEPEVKSVEESAPKARRPRGTSEFVQVKVRRSIYETLGVVAKMNSLSTTEVVEKILEVHVGQFKETLQSLRMDSIF